MAVISSILSSGEDMPISSNGCFSAEVGLSGEIRPISRIDQRIMEAEKLGFKKIFISKYNKKGMAEIGHKIEIVFVSKVEEVFSRLFG